MKRAVSFLLAIALGMAIFVQAWAEEETVCTEYKIRTVSDLEALAKLCVLDSAGSNLHVVLENDLFLKDCPDLEIPSFGGVFDGQGHTISDLTIEKEGAVRGFFRYLQPEAVVKNLIFSDAVIAPASDADAVGVLVGINEGTIENCRVSGTVCAESRSGVLVGVNEITGVIVGCESLGAVTGSAKIGGVAGENLGCIYESRNSATVNAAADDESLQLDDLRLSLISGPTTLNDATDMGGIAGFSGGVIRTSTNSGTVGYAHKGYNVGGIAGRSSGVVLDCRNEGTVLARKEGGGIVGQMEPGSTLVYTEDTLQKVRKQAVTMQGSVNQAIRDAAIANDAVREDLYDLQGDINETLRAVDAMLGVIGGRDDDGFPSFDFSDRDAVTSAASGVSTALSHTAESAYKATRTAGNGVDEVVGDMQVVSSQMNGILRTLGATDDEWNLTVDVSGENVESDGAGKIARCENTGTVRADINTGGIVGAVARENDLDPEDDYQVEGARSASFTFRSRAVILECTNRGKLTGDKRACGGIAGELRMGKILRCESYGSIASENARQVGGIAGLSEGNIEASYAKCDVSGTDYVGGIVGYGGDLQACAAMVRLANGGAYTGAIAGLLKEGAKLEGNVFVGSDAGVDGISYAGKAEPIAYEALLEREDLPAAFHKMYVTFAVDGEAVHVYPVEYGAALGYIPAVPARQGFVGAWEDFDASAITCDCTVEALYTHPVTVLEARGAYTVLLEGSFGADDALTQTGTLESCTITIPAGGKSHTLHIRVPDGKKQYRVELLQDGVWQQRDAKRDGSFLIFEQEGNELTFRLTEKPSMQGYLIAGGAGISLAAAAVWVYLKRKKA